MSDKIHVLALNWRGLNHPQAGGSEVNIFRQARRWVEQGHEVTIVVADPGRKYSEKPVEIVDGVTVRRMGNRVTVYLLALLFYWQNRHEFDCIVDVANGIPFFIPLLACAPGVLLVHHVHGRQWFAEFPRPIAAIGWFLESRIVPFIYRQWPVIAVSPTTRDSLLELGFRRSQVSVVYNGIDLPAFIPVAKPDGKRRVAYVGRFRKYKRLDKLVHAVDALRHTIPDIHLDLAGDGDALPAIKQLVAELHLENYVTFYGHVDETKKAEILSRAAVFATPSLQEGWGLSVIEANSFGCPAVAFDVPGLSVAILNGETGLLAKDDLDFEAALAMIVCDDALRLRLATGALDWAKRFDWDTAARQTLGLVANGALQQDISSTLRHAMETMPLPGTLPDTKVPENKVPASTVQGERGRIEQITPRLGSGNGVAL